jgi:hypothetical protein
MVWALTELMLAGQETNAELMLRQYELSQSR